ncbi:MAG: hypothetical protein WC236_09825 [Gallionellaceae bacterium]|jgi:hypothetical protein
MNKIQTGTFRLAQAADGNPVTTTLVVMLFFIAFNVVESGIERLIFGNRFEHFLDPIFALVFMGYAAYAVFYCAIFNSTKRNP